MMKTKLLSFALGGLVAMSSCSKRTAGSDTYAPSRAPLTADEVASLLDLHHWKINRTPDDGKPYLGVRIVLVNRGAASVSNEPVRILYPTGPMNFASPMDSKSNPQILLGIQIGSERMTGQINITEPNCLHTSRFEIPKKVFEPEAGSRSCQILSGTTWKDNRVDLIEFVDSKAQITSVVCLEFFHSPPK